MYKIKGADQQEYGPATADQVRQWIAERRANGQTLAQLEGSPEWRPLAAWPEFAEALQRFAGPPNLPVLEPGGVGVPRTNVMAVVGVILGALSLVTSWICCCAPLGVLGVIFSSIALHQIKNEPPSGNRRLALVGLGLAIGSLVLSLILTFVFSSGMSGKEWEEMRRNFRW